MTLIEAVPDAPTIDPIASIEETLSLLARRASLPSVHENLNSRAGVALGWYAYITLYWIDAEGPLRLTELAKHFGVVPSTVCRHVQQLETAGLVAKQRDPIDGRAVQLSPTEKGTEVVSELSKARQDAFADYLSAWNYSDLATLSSLMLRLRNDVSDFNTNDH